MNWEQRYGLDKEASSWSQRYAIADFNLNRNPLMESDREALTGFAKLLNRQHFTFTRNKELHDEKGQPLRDEEGSPQLQELGPKRVLDDPVRNEHMDPGMSLDWDNVIKGLQNDRIAPDSGSRDAFRAIGKSELLKHPIVQKLRRQILDQVEGRTKTWDSDSRVGHYRELHHAILTAPTDSVPALHRGVVIKTYGDSGVLSTGTPRPATRDDVLEGYKVGTEVPTTIESWSADPRIARGFSYRMNPHGAQGTQAIFHLPAGTKAMQISGLGMPTSMHQEEYLGAASVHKVVKHEVDDEGIHHIYLEPKSLPDQREPLTDSELKLERTTRGLGRFYELNGRWSDPSNYDPRNFQRLSIPPRREQFQQTMRALEEKEKARSIREPEGGYNDGPRA